MKYWSRNVGCGADVCCRVWMVFSMDWSLAPSMILSICWLQEGAHPPNHPKNNPSKTARFNQLSSKILKSPTVSDRGWPPFPPFHYSYDNETSVSSAFIRYSRESVKASWRYRTFSWYSLSRFISIKAETLGYLTMITSAGWSCKWDPYNP
jgi:hypothetical protein